MQNAPTAPTPPTSSPPGGLDGGYGHLSICQSKATSLTSFMKLCRSTLTMGGAAQPHALNGLPWWGSVLSESVGTLKTDNRLMNSAKTEDDELVMETMEELKKHNKLRCLQRLWSRLPVHHHHKPEGTRDRSRV